MVNGVGWGPGRTGASQEGVDCVNCVSGSVSLGGVKVGSLVLIGPPLNTPSKNNQVESGF